MPAVRQWLTAVACSYPLYVAGQIVANVLPALSLALLPNYELHALRVRPLSLLARAGPANGASADVVHLILTLVMLGAGTTALVRISRRSQWVPGLALGLLGQATMQTPIQVLFFLRRLSTTDIAQLIAGLVLLLAGVSMMTRVAPQRFPRRLVLLLASFPLPLAILWFAFGSAGGIRGGPGLWLALPAAIISVLAACRRPQNAMPSNTKLPSWRAIGTGAAMTAALVLALPRAGEALSRRLSEHRLAGGRAAIAAIPPVPANAPYPKLFFQRGVNFTAEYPASYGSLASLEMLERLPAYGVDAIALVPYGSSSGQAPRVRLSTGAGSWETDEGIEILARMAHHLGMRVMLKPHLWSRGASRSRIELSDPADREQWFADYRAFLEHYARLATRIHADLLCIGVELESVTGYEDRWRRLTTRARELYPGPLVYAANFGAEFESITWWDALDYIGLDNYYPLPNDFSAADVEQRIATIQARYGRPVLFTEAGFASRRGSNKAPWDDSAGELSSEDQARGYESLFAGFYSKPWFAGAYWWKVGTNGYGGPTDGSHTPWRKPAMEVVRRWYVSGGR